MRDILLQEEYIDTDYGPWKVLVICQCLNMTSYRQVEPMLKVLFDEFPSPKSLINCDEDRLLTILKPLGFNVRRAKTLRAMSREYHEQFQKHKGMYSLYDVKSMSGCGRYASDAWTLFVAKQTCKPQDIHLGRYAAKVGLIKSED